MKTNKKTLIAIAFLFAASGLGASGLDTLYFRNAEDSLVYLADRIVEPHADALRLDNNKEFISYLEEVMLNEHSFSYPFDSLQTVSFLYSPDKMFRIVTWYVPLSAGRFEYFGLIQRAGGGEISDRLIWLEQHQGGIDLREQSSLQAGEWLGAFYYDMIHHRHDGTDVYTLLAWKGKDRISRIRLVEPLVFKEGVPLFGSKVFDRPFEDNYRIVFEYSASVSMSLKYEKDLIVADGVSIPMIVFDRLEPQSESLKGHYQFYFPEVNIFDGLMLKEGKWLLVEDVDARMPDPGSN